MDDAQLEEVKNYLIENKDQFRSLWSGDSDLVNMFKSGEVVVATAGPSLAQRLKNGGVPAAWAPAKEGTLSWVCGFALSSTAQNTDAAYALMNFQASPEAQAIRAETGYLVTNPKAIELASEDYPEIAGVEAAEDALPETYPDNYLDWVDAFRQFKSS
jgi:spermidine/putrescine-binding protein